MTSAAPAARSLTPDYGWNSLAPHSCAYLAPAVLALLAQMKVRRVLDVGAGNGSLCAALAAAGYEAVGMEPDAGGVAIARAAQPQVRFHCLGVDSDPASLLATEALFDAVISTEVVEHLYAPRQLPAYAHAVLRPGGCLIVSTPYHGYLKNLALSVLDKWDHHHTALWQGGHIKFWSRATLTQLLQEAGFDVTAFHGVGRLPYLWKSMVLMARRS